MKALFERPLMAVGLLLVLTACGSELPTGPGLDPVSEETSPGVGSPSPTPLLGGLLNQPRSGDGPTLIKVRRGQRLSPDDALLSYVENSLSFPTEITQRVDGREYVSFVFGPRGLKFLPAAVLAIKLDKADLRGVNPWKLRIAVASDDRDDWEVVGGLYIPIANVVVAPVFHFSRYALCVD